MWAQRVMLRYEYSSRQGCMALVRQLQNVSDHRKCCLRGLVLLKRSRDARRRQVAIPEHGPVRVAYPANLDPLPHGDSRGRSSLGKHSKGCTRAIEGSVG